MAVFLSPVGGVAAQFFTNTGAVLTGGKLYTYLAGTTTPAATYTSASGATFNTNPIVLDAAGRVPSSGEIWLGESVQYKFVLKDSNDVLIGTYDNVTGINSNFVNYNALEEIQVATAGQTVFNLTNSYQPGTNTLSVFVDGVNQYDGSSYSYTETNSTRVTFSAGLHVGALVKFTTATTLSAGVVSSNLVTYQPVSGSQTTVQQQFRDLTSGTATTGYIPAGANAVTTTVQAKLRQTISVIDFGADPTGVADSTTAFSNALAACLNIGVEGGGVELYFPKGTYKGVIVITGQNQNDAGQYSLTLNGYGATLKGRAGDTSIIKVNGAVANIPDPSPSGSIYANGLVIQGFSFDMAAMTNSAANYAIAAQHSYACALRDVGVLNEPNLGGGLFLGSQTYTWTVQNFNCTRVSIKGYNATTNLSSVHNFYNLDAVQVVLENVFNIGFYGGVLQGSMDHFNLVNSVQNLTVIGMDLEGPNTGEVVYKIGTACRYITSIGNTPGGYNINSYSSGFAPNSNFLDRPNIAGLNGIGIYGKTDSQGIVAVTSTATPIYYFKDTQSGQNFGLFLVTGDNGSNGFQDLIMTAFGTVTTVKSQDVYGSPPARTYTNASNELRMSVASGRYQARPVTMTFLMSTT